MFARVRLQLTVWYVAVLLGIIAIVTGTAYVVLSSALNAEVDDSLRSSAYNISAQIEERIEHPPAPSNSGPSSGDDRGDVLSNSGPGSSEDSEDGNSGGSGGSDNDGDEYEGLEYFSGAGNDVFYLILDPAGGVLLNPLNVPTLDFVDAPAVEEAIAQGEAWRTVGSGDEKTRVLYVATGRDGATDSVVTVGRSLHRHNDQLKNLLTVLLATGAGGLVLASMGGFWLAGRALQPTRDAMDRQRQFVSDASHELRTPLTLIRASAEAIQGGTAKQLDEVDQGTLDDIITESDRMSGLVDELLTLAKLEEGRLELLRQNIDAADLIASAAREGELLARGAGLSINIENADHVSVRCDAVRVGQVLRILVDNAVQHTPSGGSIALGVRKTGRWGRVLGAGHGPRHHDGAPGAHLRALLPGRLTPHARYGRQWPRALDRPTYRRGAWRRH